MLEGIDVSSWQSPGAINYKSYDFVIIKASEGVNFKDPGLDGHLTGLFGTSNAAPHPELCYGFYHYARPDLGNEPEEEAKSFLSYIGSQIGYCLMALDWEGDSLNYSTDWAKRWLDYVYKQTGVKPLLYIQAGQAKLDKYYSIAAADYGLWVAHWEVDKPTYRNWQNWAIWQYRGSPLDMDKFNGDKAAWWKYCGRKEVEDLTEEQVKQIADERIRAYFDSLAKDTSVSDWAKMQVQWAMANGIMNGDVAGDIKKFRAHDFPTREELAITAYNLARHIEK